MARRTTCARRTDDAAMRHLIAWGGAVALFVDFQHDIATSDSSTAAVGWLAYPFVAGAFVAVVYGLAFYLRRRRDASAAR